MKVYFIADTDTGDVTWHYESCLRWGIANEALRKEYLTIWLNPCLHCGGYGMVSWRENGAPFGSGHNWQMTVTDLCPHCTELGKCPRCGHQHDENWCAEDWEPCRNCLWEYEKTPGIPPEWECYCYESEKTDFRNVMKAIKENIK